MDAKTYLDILGRQLAHELTAHEMIREFVGPHPDLIGKYAEASVRQFIARAVAPLRTSTGTIIHEGNYGQKPPQLDVIIWSPCPVPAVFENADFAIVPRNSAHGFLEIKSSAYAGAADAIEAHLLRASELIVPPSVLGTGALGVICVAAEMDARLVELCRLEHVAVLLEMKDGKAIARPDGVWTLVNFLTKIRLQARLKEGNVLVNYPPNAALGSRSLVGWGEIAQPTPGADERDGAKEAMP